MRELQYIEFVETTLSPLAPRWWDRPRWWLVKLLGGSNPYETCKVTRIPIDEKRFEEQLFKQRESLFRHFNREPKTLLIGAEDYEQMMDSPTILGAFRFEASYHYGRNEIYGLTINVIPWMRGVLVMP